MMGDLFDSRRLKEVGEAVNELLIQVAITQGADRVVAEDVVMQLRSRYIDTPIHQGSAQSFAAEIRHQVDLRLEGRGLPLVDVLTEEDHDG